MTRVAGEGQKAATWRPMVVLLSAFAGGACFGGPETPDYITDFQDRSPEAECEPIPRLTDEGFYLEDVVLTGDTGLLVLDGPSRRLVSLDTALSVRWDWQLEASGPTGVGSPVSVAVEDDSLFWIADAGKRTLKKLGSDSLDRGTVRLNFHPTHVRRAGGETWIVPLVLGGFPDRLLFRVDGDDVHATGPRPRFVDGLGHIGFLNMLAPIRWDDGSLLVINRFYVPEAFLWDGEVGDRFRVPVPDALEPLFTARRPVEREEDMPHLPTVAVSPYIDPYTDDIVYLTRSGRTHPDGFMEKAVIRTDSTFGYLSSTILPVDALFIGPAGRDHVVAISNSGGWHRCTAP